ncbi:uncharacterized protein I206_101085 [Kwoniella pini CBS 10737]|uniref:Required for respiratory growth protein 9, mitochondrial n=1 Tax=Kwoniella pini CBS 10737 TaxID=1296096 RepID=A0A1B9IBY1_9TREE|nr:uncharacterized protein I206_00242 [Kwoniella pini CBS 10737]OCF52941.1 hypothetical protein I206_00242 [Kwoniella pini CBS 10737]
MFIISKASSSRIPVTVPRICLTCRSFSQSTINSVKRPQKPYEAPLAKIDSYGNRIPINENIDNDKSEINRIKFLESLTERKSKSNLEKYGGIKKFGLRGKSNKSELAEIEEEEDWREKIGIKRTNDQSQYNQIRLGKKKFERANLNYLEESKRLNPSSSFRGDNNIRIKNDKSFGINRKLNDESSSSSSSSKSNLFLKSPKKNFGLSLNPRTPSNSFDNNHNIISRNQSIITKISKVDTMIQQKSKSLIEERWSPKKKLTYSAMSGLKTLHSIDSVKFSKEFLSKKFGISREAVNRILKSKYRDSGQINILESQIQEGNNLKGTKWDRDPSTSENVSPVPAILRAYGKE